MVVVLFKVFFGVFNVGRSAIVVGAEFQDRSKIVKKYCKAGRPVYLEREYDNPNDENSIAVYFIVRADEEKLIIHQYEEIVKCKIGYIKNGIPKSLALRIDLGLVVKAHVASFDLYYEDNPRVSLWLD